MTKNYFKEKRNEISEENKKLMEELFFVEKWIKSHLWVRDTNKKRSINLEIKFCLMFEYKQDLLSELLGIVLGVFIPRFLNL